MWLGAGGGTAALAAPVHTSTVPSWSMARCWTSMSSYLRSSRNISSMANWRLRARYETRPCCCSMAIVWLRTSLNVTAVPPRAGSLHGTHPLPLRSPAGTGPESPGRQRGALRQGLELGPHDGGMDAGRKGTLGEAAVGARQHVLPPDQSGIGHDAPGNQFRVLDDVGRMGDHARDEDLAVWQLDIFPHLPLVLMAWIGGFHTVGISAHPQHDV